MIRDEQVDTWAWMARDGAAMPSEAPERGALFRADQFTREL